MNEELVREIYFHEWHRRDSLTAALNIPIGLATLTGGGIVLLVQGYPTPGANDPLTWIFWISVGSASFFLVWSAYFLARSHYNYDYGRTSNLEDLRQFYQGLGPYHEAQTRSEAEAQQNRDEDFADYVERVLAAAHKRNAENNKRKADYMNKAVGRLIVALALTGVGTVPYLSKRVNDAPPELSVRLVAPVFIEGGSVVAEHHHIHGGGGEPEPVPATPPARPPEPPVDHTSDFPTPQVE